MERDAKLWKRGWLKKQGGLVRNWQDRWFVLRGKKLIYYAKDDEAKQFGCLELEGARIIETPYNREEPNKWMFEIVPAKPGKLSGHETYPIWASSESERSDWMSALRRAIYSDVGGGIFGAPLHDVMKFDKDSYGCLVPHVVQQCVDIIKADGITTEGIFRLNGSKAQVKEYRRKYDEGERPNLKEDGVDVHTSASLLKLYFREMPESVIPFEYFESFLSLATSFRYNSNYETTLKSLKILIKQIPDDNYRLLDYLTQFLSEISKHQEVNKMTEMNIALIFGTNILRGEDNSPEFEMATQNLTTHVVLALVRWHDLIFSDDDNENGLHVDEQEFKRLVSLSEEKTTDEPITNNGELDHKNMEDTNIVTDLINFDPVEDSEVFQTKPVLLPPHIPPRSCDLEAAESMQNSTPRAAPRRAKTEVIKTRTSVKRTDRPKGVCDLDGIVPLTNGPGSTITKVERPTTGFQSFIDSPLDGRISLNIGDLPDNIPDLQALVLSLKLQIKDERKKLEAQTQKHRQECECLARLVTNEREAKDDALVRVITLTQQLAEYQSQYGSL